MDPYSTALLLPNGHERVNCSRSLRLEVVVVGRMLSLLALTVLCFVSLILERKKKQQKERKKRFQRKCSRLVGPAPRPRPGLQRSLVLHRPRPASAHRKLCPSALSCGFWFFRNVSCLPHGKCLSSRNVNPPRPASEAGPGQRLNAHPL